MPKRNFENKISEFYLATSEFCKLLENITNLSKIDFLSNAQKLLSLLYLKACLLEKPDEVEDGEAEKFVYEADWEFIKDQVGSKLALSDKYIELAISERLDPESYETITLSECFADIYQDLRNFSSNYEVGNQDAIKSSIYECIENFEKYWGMRTLAVLEAFHNLIYGGEILDDEIDKNQDENSKLNSNSTDNWLINKRFNN